MAKQEPNVKISKAYDKKVERHLDPEAIEQKRTELVAISNRLNAREAQAKKERKTISKELADIKADRDSCLAAINSGTLIEEVQVKEYMYLQTGNVAIKRVDTGEVVEERPMTNEERQTEMFASPKGKPQGSDGSSATVAELSEAKAKKGKGRGNKQQQPEA